VSTWKFRTSLPRALSLVLRASAKLSLSLQMEIPGPRFKGLGLRKTN
jgi:hypothetical protein